MVGKQNTLSNPSVQTCEPNRTGGQSERAKTDLNDFKEFLVGSIVTGKDWAVWASGLGSFIRRWKGASIVAKRSLLHGVVPVPGRNVTQTGVQSTATARRRATSLRRRGRVAVGTPVCRLCGRYLAILGRPIRVTVAAVTVAPTALVGSLIRSSNLPHSLQRGVHPCRTCAKVSAERHTCNYCFYIVFPVR